MKLRQCTVKFLSYLLAASLVAPQVSCTGDNTTTGNPGSVALSIQGTSPNSLSSATAFNKVGSLATAIDVVNAEGDVVGQINLTDARIALRDIEFEFADGAEIDTDTIDFPGPFIVDLLNNSVTPTISNASLPFGIYQEVNFETFPTDGSELDDNNNQIVDPTDPLFGKSLILQGTYTGPTANEGEGTFDFTFSIDFDEVIELTGNSFSQGVLVNSDIVNDVIIAFRLARWFEFDNFETNDDRFGPEDFIVESGSITLDENADDENEVLRDIILENIIFSAEYGEDEDDDGELDEFEDNDEFDDEDDD